MRALQSAVLPVLMALLLAACTQQPGSMPRYRILTPAESGVQFANRITESDSLNILKHLYLYNGGGTATADFNRDGLPDLFFSGNMVSSRLYLNRGGLRFEEVTEAAGIATSAWCTGASVADLNADGWPDLYVSVASPVRGAPAPNLLFLHQGLDEAGIPRFEEAAARCGIADSGYSTQGAFLDFDLDGDLDLYVLTNALEQIDRNSIRLIRSQGEAPSTDRLYRNDGPAPGPDGRLLPRFSNISCQAGITVEGWGLGVVASDFNADGWPDLYVANDFLSSDLLWINQRDGTFANEISRYTAYQSHNGMGVDAADINNDGLADLIEMDMMPNDNRRQKSMFSKPSFDRFYQSLQAGYQPQVVRNTLQLRTPNGFREIGQLAGVHKTDWSWACLFFDMDNDGWRDLAITNGYYHDITDLDFISYDNELRMFRDEAASQASLQEALSKLGHVHKHNYLFHNQGNLTFADRSEEWGFGRPSYSNGMLYADLDLDGDLDLAISNLQEPAFICENRSEQLDQPRRHFLRIRLEGPPGNADGLGAQIFAEARIGGRQIRQHHYQTLVRGYKSSVEAVAHFGLGDAGMADRLEIRWPDGRQQLLRGVPADQVLTLRYADAVPAPPDTAAPAPLWMAPADTSLGLAFTHQEQRYNDFNRDKLLWHQYSQSGPGMAAGDLDGNGLDDLLIGGSAGYACTAFMQQPDGRFRRRELFAEHAAQETLGLLIFDCDGDGDQDVYAANGGSERAGEHAYFRHRLYRNEGGGRFRYDSLAIPDILASGGCVRAADFDGDGDWDLFVGGRLRPGYYPEAPRSFLLRNEGGRFTDATESAAPALLRPGLITSAIWTDADGDTWPDLLLCGEWMPVMLYRNTGGALDAGRTLTPPGWWTALHAADLDQDGDMDYAAGNLGLNSRFRASEAEPVQLHVLDLDQNGVNELLLSHFIEGEAYLAAPRDQLAEPCPMFRRRFPKYADYGRTPFRQALTKEEFARAQVYESRMMASVLIENRGAEGFRVQPLPMEAQFAPVFGIESGDFNHDGFPDLALTGNLYGTDTQNGWYAAGEGLILAGDGAGRFRSVQAAESGFLADGDQKSLLWLAGPPGQPSWLAAASNSGPLRVYRPVQPQAARHAFRALETSAVLYAADGRRQRIERYPGNGHCAQSSRSFSYDPGRTVRIESLPLPTPASP
ncbi:MAG: VCBS repeat-containing protein [Bacteroidia bacterium]|nr:VCBS repeat-containing protein [Bacteroidia bacterium]